MKRLSILSILLCLVVAPVSQAIAGEILLQLTRKTDYSRQDFGSGTYPAFMMVWGGDVNYLGSKIGDFSATIITSNYGSGFGWAMNYDIVVPAEGGLGDFISVRTNHSVMGNGADQGNVYAASPAFKSFIGSTVLMDGGTMRILY